MFDLNLIGTELENAGFELFESRENYIVFAYEVGIVKNNLHTIYIIEIIVAILKTIIVFKLYFFCTLLSISDSISLLFLSYKYNHHKKGHNKKYC